VCLGEPMLQLICLPCAASHALLTDRCALVCGALKAMNRSLANVILGGYATAGKGQAAKVEGTHTVRGSCGCVGIWSG
jgi:hypothetical protein